LVVEDEVLIRMAMAAALRELDLSVAEARDATEALNIIHAGFVPDALLTDIRLPGRMDGLRLAALLESLFPNLKVFLTSGHMASSDLRLPMNFLEKPIHPRDAARHIKRALRPHAGVAQA